MISKCIEFGSSVWMQRFSEIPKAQGHLIQPVDWRHRDYGWWSFRPLLPHKTNRIPNHPNWRNGSRWAPSSTSSYKTHAFQWPGGRHWCSSSTDFIQEAGSEQIVHLCQWNLLQALKNGGEAAVTNPWVVLLDETLETFTGGFIAMLFKHMIENWK